MFREKRLAQKRKFARTQRARELHQKRAEQSLEAQLQRKLERARIVGRCWLSGRTRSRPGGGIADGIDAAHVETIQHVESIGNHLEVHSLCDGELLGDP